jgi:hypothetical protein
MSIRSHAQSLAMASALALTVVSAAATHVSAMPKHPGDNGVRCAYFNKQTGEWEFYMPGETMEVTDSQGNIWLLTCSRDGRWVLQTSSPSSPIAPVGPAAQSPSTTSPVAPVGLPAFSAS